MVLAGWSTCRNTDCEDFFFALAAITTTCFAGVYFFSLTLAIRAYLGSKRWIMTKEIGKITFRAGQQGAVSKAAASK